MCKYIHELLWNLTFCFTYCFYWNLSIEALGIKLIYVLQIKNLTHDIQFSLLVRSPPKQQDWIPMHLCSWVPNNVVQQTQLTGRVELQLMVSTTLTAYQLFSLRKNIKTKTKSPSNVYCNEIQLTELLFVEYCYRACVSLE